MLDDHHRIKPNQGIRQSVRNGIIVGFVTGGLFGMVGLLIDTIVRLVSRESYGGLSQGLAMGVTAALLVALLMGGLAGLRHLLLRVLLACAGLMPWQTIRFLDDTARRILLYKDGGGYRFIHRLFLDYFADLEASPLAAHSGMPQSEQSHTAEPKGTSHQSSEHVQPPFASS